MEQNVSPATQLVPPERQAAIAIEMLSRQQLDGFTHTRLWKNPCGFAARFNYIALRYNLPLYGWIEREFGLSRVEYVVIYSLGLQDGITASEISVSTAFPKNTLSRAVNRLIKLGYIQRRIAVVDRRVQILSLSVEGRRILDTTLPRFVAVETEMLAPLSTLERDMLSTLLAKVVLGMFQSHPEDVALDVASLASEKAGMGEAATAGFGQTRDED